MVTPRRAFSLPWLTIAAAVVVSVSKAQVAPSTQPTTNPIVEVTLEDPVTPESRCYLDLDTGKTYPRGETQVDMIAARQFIREHGIDLMCESREPARGLVAYDMCTQQETTDPRQPPMFATLRRMFEKGEPKAFDFVMPGDELPKSYLFRTRDGAVGVLEIIAFDENPSGVRLRYCLVLEPPPQRMVNTAQINRLRTTIAVLEARLVQLRRAYSANDPRVRNAEEQLQQMRDILKAYETEQDPASALLKMRQESVRDAQLHSLLEVKAQDAERFQKALNVGPLIDLRITDPNQRFLHNPATQPARANATTQPSPKDFHM